MSFNIKLISEPLEVGTSIYWDVKGECLYFTEGPDSCLYKFNPKNHKTTKCKVGNECLYFAYPIFGKKNFFIGGVGHTVVMFNWNGVKNTVSGLTDLAVLDDGSQESCEITVGAVDNSGTLWIGTAGGSLATPGKGSLFSMKKGHVKQQLSQLGLPSGLAFDSKDKKLYLADALQRQLIMFDYDEASVELNNRSVILEGKKTFPGEPWGIVKDQRGYLWLCHNKAGTIMQIDPASGKIMSQIQVPTQQVISLCHAHKNLDVLYVTTAKLPVGNEIPEHPAGCTCLIDNPGEKGTLGNEYKM